MKKKQAVVLLSAVVVALAVFVGASVLAPTEVEASEWCETTYVPIAGGFCWGPASNCAGYLPRCPEI